MRTAPGSDGSTKPRADFRRLLYAIPGLVFTLVLWASSVSPNAAQHNLKVWYISIVDDLPDWLTDRRFVTALGIGVVLFYAGVFRARLVDTFSRFKAGWEGFRRGKSVELGELSRALDECKAATVRAELDLQSTRSDLATERHRGAGDRADARRYFETLRYGRALIEVHPPDPHGFAVMMASLHELRPSLTEMTSSTDAIWDALRADALRQPDESPIGWLCVRIHENETAHATNTLRGLFDALDADREPRPLLAGAYEAYRVWRAMACRLAAIMGKQITDISGYDAWRPAEVRFADELRKKLTLPLLTIVRDIVARCDAQFGALSAPEPVLPTAHVGPYGVAVIALALASDDERRFLDLFCIEANPMVPERPDTWLSNSVYRAGEKLAEMGILVRGTVRQSTVRFCLRDSTIRAWAVAGRDAPPPSRHCIEIDLAAVRGTGASGGGGIGSTF